MKDVRVFSNTVKHCIYANAVRDLRHPLHSILLCVKNDVIRTMCPRELRLGVCRSCTNHGGAFELGILNGDKTESPRNCVNENRIALLDLVRFVQERKDGRGLQETSSTGSGVNTRIWRDGEDLFPRDGDVLCVGASKVLGR